MFTVSGIYNDSIVLPCSFKNFIKFINRIRKILGLTRTEEDERTMKHRIESYFITETKWTLKEFDEFLT